MKEINKRKSKRKHTILKTIWLIYGLTSILVICVAVNHVLCMEYDQVAQSIALVENWDVQINEESYSNASLEELHFQTAAKGDKISMETILPRGWNTKNPVLRIYTVQSAVKVFIDNEQIYTYGYERIESHKSVGEGYLFVDFSKEYEGKKLRIELEVNEGEAFSKLNAPRIYEWSNVYRDIATENRIPLLLGSFLLIFGLILALVTVCALVISRKYMKILCASLFSIAIGLWTLCYYNVIIIYSIPIYTVSLMEYMALFLAPIPLTIYMYDQATSIRMKYSKQIYVTVLILELLFIFGTITLHTLDIVHCAVTLKYIEIMIVALMVYFAIVAVMGLKEKKESDRLYLIGILEIMVCVGYDLIAYNMERYYGYNLLHIKGFSAIGLTIYIVILVGIFYMNVTEKIMQEAEQANLFKQAYFDELTQLYNRRYCMEEMRRIEAKKEEDVAIICFDVNNLKTVNDNYGHAKGDFLLKTSAQIIDKTFGEVGVTGRMGGDEFIGIVWAKQEKVSRMLKDFERNVREKNKEIKDFSISIAYGYAVVREVEDRNMEQVYQLADKRMYEKKKSMKEKAGLP
ncbi:MAG: GGDEF domain-containing protein [Roseburia sp.]|nr:GGDEF domain-containing protein [Roseburia sp.]MCM1278211.1 GGDEF domain-containing protein [Robinsoniella sp.]